MVDRRSLLNCRDTTDRRDPVRRLRICHYLGFLGSFLMLEEYPSWGGKISNGSPRSRSAESAGESWIVLCEEIDSRIQIKYGQSVLRMEGQNL